MVDDAEVEERDERDERDAQPAPVGRAAPQATPELFNARAAALKLGYARRTAAIRAQRAYAAGDPGVRKIDNVWSATLSWWEKALEDRPRRGYRPARTLVNSET